MCTLSENLEERKKELKCLYLVDDLLKDRECHIESIFGSILDIIPPAWQFPENCRVKILFEGKAFAHYDYVDSQWFQTAELVVDDTVAGEIRVTYKKAVVSTPDWPFLPEEQKLLNAIASMVSRAIFHRRLGRTLEALRQGETKTTRAQLLLCSPDKHWKWRNRIANIVAERLDMASLGVEAIYLFGSTDEAIAGPASDIDLLVHFSGDPEQRRRLESWFEGWSLCLSEVNFAKTGYRTDGLLDVHIITDRDIEKKTSYAARITAIDRPARLLRRKDQVSVQEKGAAGGVCSKQIRHGVMVLNSQAVRKVKEAVKCP